MLKKDKKKLIDDAYKALGKKEPDDMGDALSSAILLAENAIKNMKTPTTVRYPAGLSAYATKASNTSSYIASTNPSSHVLQLPMEDLEASDMERVRGAVEYMMDSLYPPFEPEVVHAIDKDYFLPALKVLVYRDGEYLSPQQASEWKNLELEAECVASPWNFGRPKTSQNPLTREVDIIGFENPVSHSAPHETCDCGIYGSVNLEEVRSYLYQEDASHRMSQLQGHWVSEYGQTNHKKLCIIEPSPGAKVVLCRKGWKASKAFISEIVGETISFEEASNLLSISWHREVDVRRLNENR